MEKILKTIEFGVSPKEQIRMNKELEELKKDGWEEISRSSKIGKYKGNKGCCLFFIFAPLALLAGHDEDKIIITFEKYVPKEESNEAKKEKAKKEPFSSKKFGGLLLSWLGVIIFFFVMIGEIVNMQYFAAIISFIIIAILIPEFNNWLEGKYKKRLSAKAKVIIIIGFFIMLLFLPESKNISTPIQSQPTKQTTSKATVKATSYEIVETKDGSDVMDKKFIYRVVLSPDLKSNQVRPTVEKIISDITTKDKDIDEISLLLYSDKALVSGPYDIGSATWAPGGKLGNLTPSISKSNDRSSYSISIDVIDNLDEYLNKRKEKEEKFGMTEDERRQFFKEVVAAENRGTSEAEKKYPIGSDNEIYWDGINFLQNKYQSALANNIKLSKELENKYRKQVLDKYRITNEQWSEISSEALNEGWPLE